jgi:hypothetical protein
MKEKIELSALYCLFILWIDQTVREFVVAKEE